MVEDEFYSVAARFTAHLHAAQYRRLKDQAKRQSTNTINALARPVTRPPTVDVVRRQAASTLAASQRRAIATAKLHIKVAASAPAAAAAAHSDERDNDRFQIQRTHLASLMNSPRKKAQPLTRVASAGKARAAASSTCGQTSSLSTRAGTPLAMTVSLAKHHQMPTPAKLANRDDELRGIPRQAASPGRLTSEQALSQADHDSEGHDLGQYSARPSGTRSGTTNALLRQDRSTSPSKMLVTRDVSAPKESTATEDTSRTPARRSAEGNDESDSEPETYFQRRMRERRGKKKLARPRPATSNDPSGRESRPKSQDTGSAALSAPSI